jgi:hypothetical protein
MYICRCLCFSPILLFSLLGSCCLALHRPPAKWQHVYNGDVVWGKRANQLLFQSRFKCHCSQPQKMGLPKFDFGPFSMFSILFGFVYKTTGQFFFNRLNESWIKREVGRAWFLQGQVGLRLHTLGSGFCRLGKFTKYIGLKSDSGSGFTE